MTQTIFASTDPCPYCGRKMYRPTSDRFIDPFCDKCRTEREELEKQTLSTKERVIVFSENIKAYI